MARHIALVPMRPIVRYGVCHYLASVGVVEGICCDGHRKLDVSVLEVVACPMSL